MCLRVYVQVHIFLYDYKKIQFYIYMQNAEYVFIVMARLCCFSMPQNPLTGILPRDRLTKT